MSSITVYVSHTPIDLPKTELKIKQQGDVFISYAGKTVQMSLVESMIASSISLVKVLFLKMSIQFL